jgi:hypothetical protein
VLSTQQRALVEVAVRDRLLLESIDSWLLAQPKLVNHRKRELYRAVTERMRVAEGYQRRLQALGLERRARPVPSITEYLEARAQRVEAEDGADEKEASGEGDNRLA